MSFVEHCADCPYRAFGPAIGARGDPRSQIVLVGEAPGATEIDEGEPFRGPAGRILWSALDEAGIAAGKVFVTNSLACRPNPVRPRAAAIAACQSRLVRDIQAHPRRVIVALGLTAVRTVTGRRGFTLLADHGVVLPSVWAPVVPTLHPARVLRRPLERPWLVADLRQARRLATVPDG